MSVFKCKMCGGTIEFEQGATVGTCDSCGSTQTLPKLDDDKKSNLYDRANHFRRNNDFDKALSIYESILNEDKTDAEAYWSIVLCRYGIEYVEDPATLKRVPTVNRVQYTSIFDDEDYKSALQYATIEQKILYEDEAKTINEIQKGILEISNKEEPFDIFICYKETDELGRRTRDSVLANDLYHQLTQEDFKVFFSRITLEDKLGTAYEPYIFAALNSAKIMVVIGTKPEYFKAVWVKNEWSRYLALIKSGAKKVLIPAYKDMDPYDLPEEFSHLQAQDMSKLGFMQDLIRGIKKITEADKPKTVVKETVIVNNAVNANAPAAATLIPVPVLFTRISVFLEAEEWSKVNEYCEKILDQEPENGEAYLYKELAENHCRDISALAQFYCRKGWSSYNKNLVFAKRWGNEKTAKKLAEFDNKLQIAMKQKEEERELFKQQALEMANRAKDRAIVGAKYTAKYIGIAAIGFILSCFIGAITRVWPFALLCMLASFIVPVFILRKKDSDDNDNDNYDYVIAANNFASDSENTQEQKEEVDPEKLQTYNQAKEKMKTANTASEWKELAKTFASIKGFKDSSTLSRECSECADVLAEFDSNN
ncbi:toll/interleukin-1 receptor domain-containing protein [bacterium]|nr:toll/interleukin-1 receptor domain-containing protein [bacterium]